MLEQRNLMSHTYDNDDFEEVFNNISEQIAVFDELVEDVCDLQTEVEAF